MSFSETLIFSEHRILRNKRSPLFIVANYKQKFEISREINANKCKIAIKQKWQTFDFNLKSARGAYYAEYGS